MGRAGEGPGAEEPLPKESCSSHVLGLPRQTPSTSRSASNPPSASSCAGVLRLGPNCPSEFRRNNFSLCCLRCLLFIQNFSLCYLCCLLFIQNPGPLPASLVPDQKVMREGFERLRLAVEGLQGRKGPPRQLPGDPPGLG
jgi:hypothetical protein